MIRLFLCFMTAFSINYTNAQKFHAFLFCKTKDNSIGNSVRKNYSNVKQELKFIAKALNYNYVEHTVIDYKFKVGNVSKTITNADIGVNDIVFMYFSTHGAKAIKDSTIFPQLDIPNQLVSSYKQHTELLAKRPKFLITVIEACSGYLDITPQESFLFEQGMDKKMVPVKAPTKEQAENISRLFSSPLCAYIITAGNPGKNTWATPNGSIFTNCFLRAVDEYINMPKERFDKVSWSNLFLQAQQYTSDITRTTSIWYYPVWEILPCNALIKQQVTTKSSERNVGFNIEVQKKMRIRNPYDVKLSISNNSNVQIDSVVYFLHETMENPIVTVKKASNNFLLNLAVWGTFPVKAKVYMHDGVIIEKYKNFSFTNRERIDQD